ncbi:MAG TPA: potassium transporter TrkG [Nevskiaceae bacterium]|nr:potassium transporter TrkG [Nevskiaceae bacterium]
MFKRLLKVANPLGLIMMAFSCAFLAPAGWALASGEATVWAFVSGLFASFLVGLLLWLGTRRFAGNLHARDGFLLACLVWVILALVACIPLLLAIPGLSFTNAYFEAVAGLTATNATTLSGLDQLPASVNLWRCELQWIGGLAGLGVAVAMLPLLGIGGAQTYRNEAVGPIRDSRVTRRFAQTAGRLWAIYAGLTVLCFFLLRMVGMGWFDALCQALSTLSLGGFSPHGASVGYFHSPAVETIVEVFMVLAAVNFATHLAVLRDHRPRHYFDDPETRAMLLVLLLSVLGVAAYIRIQGVYPSFVDALRESAFNVISMATGAGFTNSDYGQWPMVAGLWMLMLGCLTATAGSAGGGLKMIRTLIFFKQSGREIRRLVHPNAVTVLKVGVRVVPEPVVSSVLGYVHLYTLSAVILTFVLMLSGLDFVTSFSAIISTLNNVGPGLHLVGPVDGYVGLSDFQTWICALSMLLGRLGIVVLILPFTRTYWRE